jgi:hypothetical protein
MNGQEPLPQFEVATLKLSPPPTAASISIAPGIGFSNSRFSGEEHVYRQAFFPWLKPTASIPGDEVQVRLRADFIQKDYVWTWNTTVTDASGRAKGSFHQSTFFAAPFSPGALRKRAHTFAPTPNSSLVIDRRIIDLMGQQLTLDTIAQRLLTEFPGHFKTWAAALSRVGDLSERYSD